MKSRILLGAALSSLLFATDGVAQAGDAACCLPTTSLVNTKLNPPGGGDERFFERNVGTPNVMFLVSNNWKLQQYPQRLPDGDGSCGCVDPAMDWFDKTTDGLDDFDTIGIQGGLRYFNKDSYFISTSAQLPYNASSATWDDDGIATNFGSIAEFDASTACTRTIAKMGVSSSSPTYASLLTQCGNCMASKGWWRGYPVRDGSNNDRKDAAGKPYGYWWVLDGQVLNERPPKFVIVRKTMKQIFGQVSTVRRGLMSYGPNTGNYDPAMILTASGSLSTTTGVTDLAPPYQSGGSCALSSNYSDPSSLFNAINNMSFAHDENAIAEALFTLGAYYSTGETFWKSLWQASPGCSAGTTNPCSTIPAGWPRGANFVLNGTTRDWSDSTMYFPPNKVRYTGNNGNDSFCSACQISTVILISDGMSEADNSVPAYEMLTKLAADGHALNTTEGVNYCEDFGIEVEDPPGSGTMRLVTRKDCDGPTVTDRHGPHEGNRNFADDVAFWLSHSDLRSDFANSPKKQSLFTYTIGFNVNPIETAFLRSVAKAGDGKFYSANDADGLANSIFAALEDIKKRSVSFSSASVSQVQSQGSGGAIVPRLLPAVDDLWTGQLYRFDLFNEFVEEVDKDGDPQQIPVGCTGSACSPNPQYKSEVFVVDKDGFIVTEKDDGTFVRQGTTTAAAPYWEAGEVLRNRVNAWKSPSSTTLGSGGRKLYTAIDTTGDGKITSADGLTEFSESNLSLLKPYLGVDPTWCDTTLPDLLGLTLLEMVTKVGFDLLDADRCARLLIQYIRGRDIFDVDTDGSRSDNRPTILADMFHSSPVVVDPPVEKFICEMGLHNQCVRTLYSKELGTTATPLKDYDYGAPVGKLDAYDEFRKGTNGSYCGSTICEHRRKIIVVGSNDGVFHAFDNGTWDGTKYNAGTGKELWGFIPPDLLPKLKLLTDRRTHHYMIDGDIMVREVWTDLNNNDKKEADEYRTIAIGSEGRGGNHYFALDITTPESPKFRWMYPEACTREAVEFGYTFYALHPKPPPIGPVLLKKSSGGIARYGVSTEERWTAWLSGGYDPQQIRGRGIYAVDAYTGAPIWKFRVDPGDEIRKHLAYSIAAPVALVDYGSNADPVPDGFFDTAVVGDTGGQLWVTRMYTPGNLTAGNVTNWNGARSFQMDRDGNVTTSSDDDAGTDGLSIAKKSPFYYIASVGIQPDNRAMRVFIGTGDRSNLKDTGPGQCRADNPAACSKLACGEFKSVVTAQVPGFSLTKGESHWGSTVYKHSKWDNGTNSKTACGDLDFTIHSELKSCQASVDPGTIKDVKVRCNGGVCTETAVPTVNLTDFGKDKGWTVPATIGNNRFFGFWAYGIRSDRRFDETKSSSATGADSPKEFDDKRLTDTAGTAGNRELVNVTTATSDASGNVTGPQASADGNGWFIDYFEGSPELPGIELSERTASGSALIASCVLWNTINPSASVAQICGDTGESKAFFYQADFLTGAPNCAASFRSGTQLVRKLERQVLTPPPEPATVIQLSKTGAIRYSTMLLEPGQDQATQVNVDATRDVLQLIYETPSDRDVHECRHVDRKYCP